MQKIIHKASTISVHFEKNVDTIFGIEVLPKLALKSTEGTYVSYKATLTGPSGFNTDNSSITEYISTSGKITYVFVRNSAVAARDMTINIDLEITVDTTGAKTGYKYYGTDVLQCPYWENTINRLASPNSTELSKYQIGALDLDNFFYKPTTAGQGKWQNTQSFSYYKNNGHDVDLVKAGYLPVDFTYTPKEDTSTAWDEGFTISSINNAAILIHSGTNPNGDGEDFIFSMEYTSDYIFEGASNNGKGTYHTYKDIADPGKHSGASIKKTFERLGYVPKAITLILGAGGGAGGIGWGTKLTHGAGGGGGGGTIGVVLKFDSAHKYLITVGYYGGHWDSAMQNGGNSIIECQRIATGTSLGTIIIPGGNKGSSAGGAGTGWEPSIPFALSEHVYLLDWWNGRAGGAKGDAGEGFAEGAPYFGAIYNSETKMSFTPKGGASRGGEYAGGGGASAAYNGGETTGATGTSETGKYGSGGAGGMSAQGIGKTGGRGWFILVY